MKYVKDSAKLANIMKSLAEHDLDVKQYFLAVGTPRIMVIDNLQDKLVKLFVLANADRLGTGKDNENLVKATATFREYLCQDLISSLLLMKPGDAHQRLLTALCDIKWMDQKTANLFLKSTVMFADELDLAPVNWRLWEPYLHVPLDKWVLRLIGKNYLHVCGDNFETDFQYKGDYPSPSLKTDRYAALQDDIKQVAGSANLSPIVLDSLWFVGSHYCSYHPLLCDICWLGEHCAKYEIVRWDEVQKTLKSDEREERKRHLKAFREIRRVWKSENPGKTDSDLINFLEQPEGREWLRKFLKE